MARARNIKPGFFKNEDLAECTPWARLCFAGLWTLADREGRLEDRPKRIKGELFAFDSVEVEPLLGELHNRGFILRYCAADGRRLIQILEFAKHQNPHHREPSSDFPAPESPGLLVDAKPAKPKAEAASDGDEAPGETGASPGPDADESTLQRGQAGLIPDSGTLNPDSNSVPTGTGADGAKAKAKITDPNEIIFGYGLPLLTNAGTPEKQARSFLGGLRKHHGDSSLIDALRECIRVKPLQPLEWLAKALPPPSAGGADKAELPSTRAAREAADILTGGRHRGAAPAPSTDFIEEAGHAAPLLAQ